MKKLSIILFAFIVNLLTSCEKFVETDPPTTSLVEESIFSDDKTAESAIISIYQKMGAYDSRYLSGDASVTYYGGLLSDELDNLSTSSAQIEFYRNSLTANNNGHVGTIWNDIYEDIYITNSILLGVEESTALTVAMSKQLRGEALFMRSFLYLYLVNLFGDVPFITSTDYRQNALASRNPKAEILAHITNDLIEAETLLPETYTNAERIRPIQSAATALLARVYLYTQKWAEAEATATKVINNPLFTIETDLTKTFLKESPETIWQIQMVLPGRGTFDGFAFVFSGSMREVMLSENLLGSYDTTDKRRINWVSSRSYGTDTFYYSSKYKNRGIPAGFTTSPEDLIVLRKAEQYLIRAEARAHQDNVDGAQEDIDVIRDRAGLAPTNASDQSTLLIAVEQERRFELLCEMGHRWFDLCRTDRADVVLPAIKGSDWQTTDKLWPIPQIERLANPNLTQNSGY